MIKTDTTDTNLEGLTFGIDLAGPEGDRSVQTDGPVCAFCYRNDVPIRAARCLEKPELLLGQPLGMYHCPDCGSMVLAGLPHPPLCDEHQPCGTQSSS
jgi:hypothetical protein